MDNLKNYLQEHRDEMDVDTPGDNLWQNIQARSAMRPGGGRTPVRRLMRYAAAACILTVIGIAVKRMTSSPADSRNKGLTQQSAPIAQTAPAGQNPPAISAPPRDTPVLAMPPDARSLASSDAHARPTKRHKSGDLRPDDPVLSSLEKSYTRLVSWQLKKLRATPVLAEEPGYFDAFTAQFRQIEQDETSVRRDIRSNGLNDDLLEQLINVYQQKLNLLKNLQSEITKMNNRVKEKQPETGLLNPYYLHL